MVSNVGFGKIVAPIAFEFESVVSGTYSTASTLPFSRGTQRRPLQPVCPAFGQQPIAYTALKRVLGDSFASRAATIWANSIRASA